MGMMGHSDGVLATLKDLFMVFKRKLDGTFSKRTSQIYCCLFLTLFARFQLNSKQYPFSETL